MLYKRIAPNLDTLQGYLLQYAQRNLIETEKRGQLLETLFKEYPFLDGDYTLPKDIPDCT